MVNVSSDQREFLRIPATYRVKVVAPDQIIELTRAINISMGGILIGGPERLPVRGCRTNLHTRHVAQAAGRLDFRRLALVLSEAAMR